MPNKTTPKSVAFWIILVALPSASLFMVLRSHNTFTVFSHYLGGRACNCTLAESFEAEALSRLQAATVSQVHSAPRVMRTDGRLSLWSTRAGEYWVPGTSKEALLYDLAEQDRNIYRTRTRIRPGDVVLDAGANVGVFTRRALWAGAAKVVAIEPGPENLECLRRTFADEIAKGRVVVYPKGVWDKDDVLKLQVDPGNSARDSFVAPIENAQFIEVPLTTIDKMTQELRLSKVDFIKMDIEGAEQKAILGAKNTIARFHPRMSLCTYHLAGDDTMVPKLVKDIVPGYNVSKTCLFDLNRIQAEVAFFD